MKIRNALPQDYAQIVLLLQQIAQLHQAGRPDLTGDAKSKHDEEDVAKINANPDTPILVAVDGDVVLGYIFCIIKDYPPRGIFEPYRCLYIDDLCVDEAHRNKGVATQLYEAAIKFGRQRNCSRMELNVWEFNQSAIRFYEAMGMKTQRRIMEAEI